MTIAKSPTMNSQEFDSFASLIYERSGIQFKTAKKYLLEARLSRRLEELKLETYDQYLMFLTTGPYQNDEFQEMFNRITVNETSFFRTAPQLDYLETHVLPELIAARAETKRLRIWSAACSTGDEPYSLAIMVHRTLGLRLLDWNIEIMGTDISEKVLAQAVTGRYSEHSLRTTPDLVRNRYFHPVEDQPGTFELDAEIRRMVRFQRLNLKDPFAARRFGAWDLIFCRNVMIYFDDDMKRHCVQLFHDTLEPDGVLFVGHCEVLPDFGRPLEAIKSANAFAYRKPTSN